MTSVFDTTRKLDALRLRGLRLTLKDEPSAAEPSRPWVVEARRDGEDVVIFEARAPTVEVAVERAWKALKDGHPEPPRQALDQVRVTRSALERLQRDHPGLNGVTARDMVAESREVPLKEVWPLLDRRHDASEADRAVYMVTPARRGVLVLVPDRERTDGRLTCVTYLPLRDEQASQARRMWP